MKLKSCLKKYKLFFILFLFLLANSPDSWAAHKLWSLNRPLKVKLETAVSSENAWIGQPFIATLEEPTRYKNWTLPQNTQFKGHIASFGHSKHFGRPGYVILQTDQVTFPGAQIINFDQETYKARKQVLHNKDAQTFLQSVGIQIPYEGATAAVTLPLYYAAGVKALPLIAIGWGTRIITGSVMALFRPRFESETTEKKLISGAVDGSGISRALHFVGKYPEADYSPGEKINLYLGREGLKALFLCAPAATKLTDLTVGPSTITANSCK